MKENKNDNVRKILEKLSDSINEDDAPIAVILAAGHGKRIKSGRSKMLHEIWGVPTVVRVANAAANGLKSYNQIIVVGKKAEEVAQAVGKSSNRIFVYQEEQRGTGDAMREALSALGNGKNIGDIYIFPGDMGLLTSKVVSKFREAFERSGSDMMVLTGIYKGDPEENTYGRILRIRKYDASGDPSGSDEGKPIEIKEHKDILAMGDDSVYEVSFHDRRYKIFKEELLSIREYNAGVYAIKYKPLRSLIDKILPDNVQSELYLTDIISLFVKDNLSVDAAPADDNSTVIGFNVKSTLHKMESIARRKVWKLLRDIIFIEDEDDFFIADEVVKQLLDLDTKYPSLDINIGKGVHVGRGVIINRGITLKTGGIINGNVDLGEGTVIEENVWLSTYPHQKIVIGKNCVIMRSDIVKGNIKIGDNTRIESGVNLTGSDKFPTIIGSNVIIKGTSYIFGSEIEDGILVEHSVLKCKKVEKTVRKDGDIQPVKWVMPPPQGLDIVTDLNGSNSKNSV